MSNNPKHILINLLIWLVLVIGLAFAVKQPKVRSMIASLAASEPAAAVQTEKTFCEPLPETMTTTIIDKPVMRRTDTSYGSLIIKNNQSVFVVALLTDATTPRKLQAVSVDSGGSARIKVPSGQYGLNILSGRNWCNIDTGFTDGVKDIVSDGIRIRPDGITEATITPSPQSTGHIDIGYREYYDTEEVRRGGLDVYLSQASSSYLTSGSVNGTETTFVIDTGATNVTIPESLAKQAGIECTQKGSHATANGVVSSCYGVAKDLEFGPFHLKNILVSVLPNLGDNALLGMSVLRRFNMIWSGDVARITTPDSGDKSAASDTRIQVPEAAVVEWLIEQSESDEQKPGLQEQEHDPDLQPMISWFILLLSLVICLFTWKTRKAPAQPERKTSREVHVASKNVSAERVAASLNIESPLRSLQERLLEACNGNEPLVARLMEFETLKAPFITDFEAARRALERFSDENK